METIEKAKAGDTVKIHFTCKLQDGTVLDTSEGKDPLQFTMGQGEVMKGLEQAVTGMQQGETRTATIKAEDAFGPSHKEKIQIVSRDQFPPDIEPVAGMKFEIKQEDGAMIVVYVTDVTESTVTLDANHPLAGKDLIFDIEIAEIKTPVPDRSDEYYAKAVDYQSKDMIDEAISYYQKAIESNPKHAQALYNLAVALQQKGFIDKAILYYEIAIGLNQEFVEAHHNLGVAYSDKGSFDEAEVCFRRAIQLKPDHAGAYYNFGNALVAQGKFQEALQLYQKAIDIVPDFADAHWAVSLIKLRFGNFEDGWKGYEWRWKLKDMMTERNFAEPRWTGSDIHDKTILLHAEQGLGDTIQFIRYAPLVARRSAHVILECQKGLTTLLRNVEGIEEVIATGKTLPHFDMHCPLMSLPLVFQTSLENIPDEVPYIRPDSGLIEKWRNALATRGSHLKIGLVWSGDPRSKFGQDRSCPLEKFSPLAKFDDVVFYSLQKGGPSRQVFTPPDGMRLVDLAAEIDDFSETAALIENLDLVISVDTAAAHLAGALGKPVWVLLPFVPDWRWMLNRDDTPWYPTMRLFRQPARGDWDSVIAGIKENLPLFGDLTGRRL